MTPSGDFDPKRRDALDQHQRRDDDDRKERCGFVLG
jgi:hypothetical protein